jgi:hypothetical protein
MRVIIPGDHGFVTTVLAFDSRLTRANNMATRRFVLAARRPSWSMTLSEMVGGVARPIADLPGDKEASASMLVDIDKIIITYTARAIGAPDGAPLDVCEHVVAVPGIWPIDIGAAARLRSLAGILRVQLPQLKDPLASFES